MRRKRKKIINIKYIKAKNYMFRIVVFIPLFIVAMICVIPFIYIFANSFMSSSEIFKYYGDVNTGQASLHFIPDMISADGYYAVFIKQPDYLMKFWNSLLISGSVVSGQVIISCLAGYAFAKFRFPFRNGLLFLYIVFMMLPFIVTLVPNEIMLRRFGLIDNIASLILPGIFAPFGVFLMRQAILVIPNEILESGQLDGAGQMRVLFNLVLPQCKAGIASVVILTFIDSWNMVEQPLAFIRDVRKHPLSVFLSYIGQYQMDLVFVCSVLAIIPALLLYFNFEDELLQGIEYMGLQ